MALLRLTDVRPDAEIDKLLKETISNAEEEWKPLKYEGQYPVGGFGITELRPKHVPDNGAHAMPYTTYAWGSISWAASISAAATYEDWMDITLTDMAYVIQTGVFNLDSDPQITEIAPSANGQDMPTVNLEQMYALDLARVWLEKPFGARPNNTFKNRLVARAAHLERIGLLGYCVAKRAYLITR